MQIKNKKNIFTYLFFIIFALITNAYCEEFNITAKEIIINKDSNILTGTGSVQAVDSEGKTIEADKIIYDKTKEFLTAEGNVKISDVEKNVIESDKITYDKLNEVIKTYSNSILLIEGGYKLATKDIVYNVNKKILSSPKNSVLTDADGNLIETTMFQYEVDSYLFSSIGKIKIIDEKKNKYFFKELYVDTQKKEMIGSDVSVVLDEKNFGLSEENDPRLVSNDIFISKNKSELSKGVFTVCKKRDGKCPPWSIKAKKIIHDNTKKTIYYKSAVLKLYDIPIFYFPNFFHPDPTVKRQSGFLFPFFTSSTSVGTGFATPYYWAIDHDKDLTFTPKYYTKENILFLNEYRQAFKNGFLTLDTSFTEGYKNTSEVKKEGSKFHIFSDLKFNFGKNKDYESDLLVKFQKASDSTYFRQHNINTTLVDSENTTLENQIKYNFSENNMYFNIATNVYEDLR